MATLKCKSCGGNIELIEGQTLLECDSCGRMQTVPVITDERKGRLFDRANLLRQNCEFDKASILYEDIVAEYPEEAEGYWGLVLCKCGIEYVDDPSTKKKIPTCHRTLSTPVLYDEDYKNALKYASILSQQEYKREAEEIDEIQKKILDIASREDPYDIFICYKETDELGYRTDDSTIAQDIYTSLISEGYKVFFSRITLRGMSGTEYEPYIYSALSSARVMLVIGTEYEFIDATWVKNEWSRYLSMMSSDKSKILIPCVKGIRPDGLPEKLKGAQALEVSSVTFYKDLTASIKRAIPDKSTPEAAAAASSGSNVQNLLKRANIFLSDGDFESADLYCEKALDTDPECACAYLYKFMVSRKLRCENDILALKGDLKKNGNFEHAYSYAKGEEKEKLQKFLDTAIANMEREQAENEAERQRKLTEGIDRATELVAVGEFEKAQQSIAAALADNTADARAYLIAILAKNKAKGQGELVCMGASVEQDENYKKLLERCRAEDKAHYEQIPALCAVGCMIRLMECVSDSKAENAGGWLSGYTARIGEDEISRTAKQLLGYKTDIREKTRDALALGEALKKKIKELSQTADECTDALLSAANTQAGRLYFFVAGVLLGRIRIGTYEVAGAEGGSVCVDISELEDEWADPKKGRRDLEGADISRDGQGDCPALRYMNLAKLLWKELGAAATARIDRLTNNAYSVCSPDQSEMIAQLRTQLYIEMANSDKASRDAIVKISDLDPTNAALAWACAERISGGFTKTTAKNYDSDLAYEELVTKKKKQLICAEIKKKIESIEGEIAALDTEEAERLEAPRVVAERAISLNSDKKEEYIARYKEYIELVKGRFADLRQTLSERKATLGTLYTQAYGRGKRKSTYHTVKKLILAVVFAAAAAYIALIAKKYTDDPSLVLGYYGLGFFAVTTLGSFVIGNVFMRILTRASERAREVGYELDGEYYGVWHNRTFGVFSLNRAPKATLTFREHAIPRIAVSVLSLAVLLLTLLSTFMFGRLPFVLSDSVGVVSISTPDQIGYIKNHPYLDYKLTADIDLTDMELPTVFRLSGSIDGDGHTLSGISSSKTVIHTNRATVKNLNIDGMTLKKPLINTNRADIEGVSVSDVSIAKNLIKSNHAAIKGLKLSAVDADTHIIDTNRSDIDGITLEGGNLNAGMIHKNTSIVKNVTVSGATVVFENEDVFDEFGFVSDINEEKGVLSDCTVVNCTLISRSMIDRADADDTEDTDGRYSPAQSTQAPDTEAPAPEQTTAPDTSADGTSADGTSADGTDTEAPLEFREITKESHIDRVDAKAIGLIVGNNKGQILYSKVENIDCRAVVTTVFGGIAGISEGDITDCHVTGKMNIYVGSIRSYDDETGCLYGGIVGEQRCRVSYCSMYGDIWVGDYERTLVCMALGGVAGEQINGNVYACSFGGTLKLGSTDLTYYNYNSSNVLAIGGIVGHVEDEDEVRGLSVTDSYSYGRLELVRLYDETRDNIHEEAIVCEKELHIGGLTGYADGITHNRCYSSCELVLFEAGDVKIDSSLTLGGMAGTGSYGECDNIDSFFAGIINWGTMRPNSTNNKMAGQGAENCYYASGCGYVYDYFDDAEEINRDNMLTGSFIYDTLGWSREVWYVAEGYLPSLNPYKRPTVQTESADSTTAADTAVTEPSGEIVDTTSLTEQPSPEQ